MFRIISALAFAATAVPALANDIVTEAAPAAPRPDRAPVIAAVVEIEKPDADRVPLWLQMRIEAAAGGLNKDPDSFW